MTRIIIFFLTSSLFFHSSEEPKRVFVIGDSISMQYGPYLDNFLGENLIYDRLRKREFPFEDRDNVPYANGQDSRNVLKQVKRLLASPRFQPDVFLLNCGLHDIKASVETQENQVPLPEYATNLDSIFRLLHERHIHTIWIRTTPVVDSIHNQEGMSFFRFAADLNRYNAQADSLCSALSIPQIDLYRFTISLGEGHFVDHVHFDEEVRKLQGAYIAGYLNNL